MLDDWTYNPVNNVTAASLPENLTITNDLVNNRSTNFDLIVETNSPCKITSAISKFYRNGAYICNETVYNTSYNNLQVGSNLVPNCYLSDYNDIKADEVVIMINTGRYDKPIYFESKHIKVNVSINARSLSSTILNDSASNSTSVNNTPKKKIFMICLTCIGSLKNQV